MVHGSFALVWQVKVRTFPTLTFLTLQIGRRIIKDFATACVFPFGLYVIRPLVGFSVAIFYFTIAFSGGVVFYGHDITYLLKHRYAILLVTARIQIGGPHINLIEIPVALKGVISVYVFVGVDELDHPPPEAANLVSYDKGDQNESDDFVGIHSNLLRLDSVCSGRLVIIILDQSLNFGNIEELD